MSDTLITPEFRVSYPYVFTPQEQKNDDGTTRKEYSVVAIFPLGADLTAIKKLAEDALVAKFGPKREDWPANLRSPFRKCKEKWKSIDGKLTPVDGYEEGEATWITLKATEKYKPGVVNAQVQPIIEPREFYAGCYALAQVHAYAYKHKKGGAGVSIGLNNVQKIRDGEPLGGSGPSRPEDAFTPVANAGSVGKAGAASVFD